MYEQWVEVAAATEVTDDILDRAVEIADDRYTDGERIDWDDVLDRLEGMEINGGVLSLGDDMTSPAIKRIKAHVRAVRRSAPR